MEGTTNTKSQKTQEAQQVPDASTTLQHNNNNIDVGIGGDVDTDQFAGHREYTRSKMAILFVVGFFAVIFLCFIYSIAVTSTVGELKDLLTAIIGALSGTLGFIVGFYYKSSLEK